MPFRSKMPVSLATKQPEGPGWLVEHTRIE
jgi:hypothetical protein